MYRRSSSAHRGHTWTHTRACPRTRCHSLKAGHDCGFAALGRGRGSRGRQTSAEAPGATGPTITAWMSSVFSRAASWLSLPSACLFSANTTHGRGQCVAARRPDHSQARNRASGPAARQRVWPWASSSPGKVPPQSRSPSGPERRRASQVQSHGTRLSVHGVAALPGPSQSQGPGRGQGGTWVSTTVWKGGQCRPWSPEDADSGLGWGMGGGQGGAGDPGPGAMGMGGPSSDHQGAGARGALQTQDEAWAWTRCGQSQGLKGLASAWTPG